MRPVEAIRELGFRSLAVVAHLGQLLLFLVSILRASLLPPWRPRRWLEEIWGQGVLSLVIICVSGLAVGMVLGLQGYNTLVRFGAEGSLGAVVGLSLIRELGPVLAALLVTGRAGSAIGVMRVTEELDAMRVMGISHGFRLILPKVIALAIAMPLLVAWTDLLALAGGILAAKFQLDISPTYFITSLRDAVPVANLRSAERSDEYLAVEHVIQSLGA